LTRDQLLYLAITLEYAGYQQQPAALYTAHSTAFLARAPQLGNGMVQDSGRLQDGAHQKPSYSLRTLCRALEYCRTALPLYGMQRALLDGLKMAFMTQLDPGCSHIIHNLINLHVTGSAKASKVQTKVPESEMCKCVCRRQTCS